MLVFNIKLRSSKTRINSRISAVNTALLIRNVETRKFASLLVGQKGVCPRTLLKYYAVLSLRGRVEKTLLAHWQERQALKVKNLQFFRSTTYLQ